MLMTDIIFSTYGEHGVVVTHKPTCISAFCDIEKSQFKNRDKAIKDLKLKVGAINKLITSIEEIKVIANEKPDTKIGELL